MKLILRADVDPLGRLREIVTVKPGYGRNFLLPKGLAMPATKANLKQFELERKKLEAKADALRAEAKELAEKLTAAPLVINVRVGDNDKLYGSVTSANIGDALEEKGIEIDRRKIVVGDPIRALGEYTLEVRLHPDVHAELVVHVLRMGQTELEVPEEVAVSEEDMAEAEAVIAESVEEEAAEETVEETAEDTGAEQDAEQPEE